MQQKLEKERKLAEKKAKKDDERRKKYARKVQRPNGSNAVERDYQREQSIFTFGLIALSSITDAQHLSQKHHLHIERVTDLGQPCRAAHSSAQAEHNGRTSVSSRHSKHALQLVQRRSSQV